MKRIRDMQMLIRSFNLGEAKSVVTPGVKTAIDEDVDPDQVDAEAAIEINRIIAELKPQRSHCGKVRFCSEIKTYDIPAYSTIYGSHPREFLFDKRGRKISPGTGDAVDKSDTSAMTSPNLRRSILERELRNGAGWETPTSEFIGRISKTPEKKFVKARIGSKAAKQAERMEVGGETWTTRQQPCTEHSLLDCFISAWTALRRRSRRKSCAATSPILQRWGWML